LSRRHEQKYREYQSHMKQPPSALAQPAISLQTEEAVQKELDKCSAVALTTTHLTVWASFTKCSTGSSRRRPTGRKKLLSYIKAINSPAVSSSPTSVSAVANTPEYAFLLPQFERVVCTPASSAPVERVFSQSGLLLRPHRARTSDKLLESLVFLKCN